MRRVQLSSIVGALLLLGAAPSAQAQGLAGFSGSLTGAAVVPSTPSAATGYAHVVQVTSGSVGISARWTGLAAACTAINVRGPAAPGATGPVVSTTGCAGTSSSHAFAFAAAPAVIANLRTGLLYLEIVNGTYPGGEIRTQVLPDGGFVGRFTAAGVVPTPSTSPAAGVALATLAPDNVLHVTTMLDIAESINESHLHDGLPGTVGTQVSAASVFDGITVGYFVQLTPTSAADLKAGKLYFDVHTTAFPNGSVRAQLHRPNTITDFDGEGRADFSLFRSSTATWYMQNPLSTSFMSVAWGANTDQRAPGDYDGDGASDVAVFRNGTFYIRNSLDGSFRAAPFGLNGDLANIPGDFDGDGRADIAVFRSNGVNTYFYWLQSVNDAFRGVQWGVNGDRSVNGDYDGDRKSDVGVYRPSTNTYYILASATGALTVFPFGVFTTDYLAPGDYDGDGKTDFAVYRFAGGGAGVWYIWQSSTGTLRAEAFGAAGDVAVPGDYDGDGKTDLAVVRAFTNLTWYVKRSSDGGLSAGVFGLGNDTPAAYVLIR